MKSFRYPEIQLVHIELLPRQLLDLSTLSGVVVLDVKPRQQVLLSKAVVHYRCILRPPALGIHPPHEPGFGGYECHRIAVPVPVPLHPLQPGTHRFPFAVQLPVGIFALLSALGPVLHTLTAVVVKAKSLLLRSFPLTVRCSVTEHVARHHHVPLVTRSSVPLRLGSRLLGLDLSPGPSRVSLLLLLTSYANSAAAALAAPRLPQQHAAPSTPPASLRLHVPLDGATRFRMSVTLLEKITYYGVPETQDPNFNTSHIQAARAEYSLVATVATYQFELAEHEVDDLRCDVFCKRLELHQDTAVVPDIDIAGVVRVLHVALGVVERFEPSAGGGSQNWQLARLTATFLKKVVVAVRRRTQNTGIANPYAWGDDVDTLYDCWSRMPLHGVPETAGVPARAPEQVFDVRTLVSV